MFWFTAGFLKWAKSQNEPVYWVATLWVCILMPVIIILSLIAGFFRYAGGYDPYKPINP